MKIKIIQKLIDILRGKRFFNFVGKNNKIIIPDKCKFNLIKLFAFSRIEIKGDNNMIIFRGEFKLKNYFNILLNLDLKIKGNDNTIDIEFPITFRKALINIKKNQNTFKIKSTKYVVRDAQFHIADGGTINIGNDSQLGNGNLYAVVAQDLENKHKLVMGDNVFVARDAIIRTCDGHTVVDPVTKKALNAPQDIIIGNNVWITSRCTILKGSQIQNNTIVGANSLVNKKFQEENIVIAGSPAKIIKKNICWDPRHFDIYTNEQQEANYETRK
ncbi:hypothetical protein J6Q66_06795 [bacterium]|nr:hypothetical protein [bacterium]